MIFIDINQMSDMNSINLHPSAWIDTLPSEWKKWVMENVERGCNPAELAQILSDNGFAVENPIAESHVTQSNLQTESMSSESHAALSFEWKKWLAHSVINQTPQDSIMALLQTKGYSEQVIQTELAQIKHNPYVDLARDLNLTLKKREWLMHTIDGLARLDSRYKSSIDKIKTPDFSVFMRDYYSKHLPVILTHGIEHWPARHKWNPDYFLQQVGDATVEVQQGRDTDPLFERRSTQYKTSMLMKDFIAQVLNTEKSNNFYMTANNAAKNINDMAVLFQDLADFGQGYTQPNQMKSRSFLWFGPKGTFTPMHHDLTNNMLVQIYGRKKVTLIPALQVPYVYNDHWVYSEIANPHDPSEQQQHPLLKHTSALEFVLEPGDALFIPIGWWHCVESLDVSMSVSFTHFNAENGFASQFPAS